MKRLVWPVTPEGKGITLDFFAGSPAPTPMPSSTSTAKITASANTSSLRWADHFDTVLKPRVMKAIYAEKWKDAKPVSRESRLSHIIKYQRIESYEDALNNIEFTEREGSLFDEHLLSYLVKKRCNLRKPYAP